MAILLVNMPWSALDTPSLALGILQRIARTEGEEVETVHANLDFYDWVAARVGLTTDEYEFLAADSHPDGYGDWIFASALYADPGWRLAEFRARGLQARYRDLCERLHRLTPQFVTELAARIVAAGPDVVGFTTTSPQTTAALAAARRIKQLAPHIITVFGGADCDGAQGAALHRNFPFVDYVVRGDGERAFPALLRLLRTTDRLHRDRDGRGDGSHGRDRRGDGSHGRDDAEAAAAAIPGLCWRTADGLHRVNSMSAAPPPDSHLPEPDFTSYFARVERSAARPHIEPKLVLEGSRGCWWGQRRHCAYCGLDESSITFRGKDPEEFLQEIVSQARRHRVLDIVAADNVLDRSHLQSLLPGLAELGYDLRIHYDVRSDLNHRQVQLFARAGLVQVRPGIENLSTRVLRLLDKGVTGCQNVRHLRDVQSAGVFPTWNYLYGIPGETEEDYDDVIRQLPMLHHLTPPEAVTRLVVERFSPYFDRPEPGFSYRWPAARYRLAYDLPEEELTDLAHLFEVRPAGIGETTADRLRAAIRRWREAHPASRLTHLDLGHEIVLVSRRPDYTWTTHTIRDPVEVAAFRLLADPRSVSSLARRLTAQLGVPVSEERVTRILADWRAAGIVYTDAGRYVHVAPRATNAELTRAGAPVPRTTGAGATPARPMPSPPPRPSGSPTTIRVRLWRDYWTEALRLPGMYLGSAAVPASAGEAAREYYRSGVRRVELLDDADLTGSGAPERALRVLDLVRELTAWGIVVDWTVRFADAATSWPLFSHLYPPRSLPDAPDAHARWLDGFFLGRCLYRLGPGFVEIRDRRRGVLNRIVVDDSAAVEAVRVLATGGPVHKVPSGILADFQAEALVLPVGDGYWWAPYRPYRWAQPPRDV
jgi:ribosomal peptide maturation radical SAM protein 1